MLPVIVYEGFPSCIRVKEKSAEALEVPFELQGFFKHFDELILSPSVEEALIAMDKEDLFTDPHFFYIFSDSDKFLREQALLVRKDPSSVLSPLFININLYTDVMEVIDGVFKSFSEIMVNKSLEIWEILNKFDPNPYAVTLPENKRINYIRFLVSRKWEEEKPVLQKDSIKGFFYPKAFYIFFPIEKGMELDELENLKLHKILTSEITNKTSLCPFCEHYNIIFREVCPSCGSVRIRLVEFIHHYSCGYIGPVDEFIKGDKLVCPKCHEELKHIGVDYDKPLEKYLCDDCKARFLEPDIDVLCANCKKSFTPEEVKSEFIHKFFLTSFGKLVAFEGRLPLNVFEEVTVSLGVINYNAFAYILDKFLKIAERYPNKNFCVLGIFFSVSSEAIAEVPLKVRIFLKNLITIIKDSIRSPDILGASEEKYIFILLPETPAEGGRKVKDRIYSQIMKLLQKNKLSDFVKFRLSLKCIPSEEKFSTAQELLKAIVEGLEV